MIFLRYESFQTYIRTYPATVAVIALNIIYFIVVALNGDPNSIYTAIRYGAFVTAPGIDPFGLEEPWRYVTSIFMHGGLDHLFFNLFALLVFTPPLEYLLKTFRYVPFYLACGIGGNLLSAAMAVVLQEQYHVAVGASGAIYGVYGAYLFIALFRKKMLDAASRRTVYIILAFGAIHSFLVSNVDLWGHAGGALTGFVLYRLLEKITMWKQGGSKPEINY